MKVLRIILIIISVVAVGIGLLIWLSSRPITTEVAHRKIQKIIDREVAKYQMTQALVLVESGSLGFNGSYAAYDGENPIATDKPFHVASVGKAFTAKLVGLLVDRDEIHFDDPITSYLDKGTLKNLFFYEDLDLSGKVTIAQLLNHTSGVADYFEDPSQGVEPMAQLVLQDPNHFWTPRELVEYTQNHQVSVGEPGESYHYSDTGYILLGLIIEEIYGKPFHQVLHQEIFTPLNMSDSYLTFYSEPENDPRGMADIWFNGTEISGYESLSIDWAGGGIVSTLDDLALFIRALNTYKIISEVTLKEMYRFDHKFTTGIYYGYGFMEYHFSDYFPTLSFLPQLKGHMGVLGTQMLYDKPTDTVYICSFGSTDYSAGSVKTMIKVLSLVYRIKKD